MAGMIVILVGILTIGIGLALIVFRRWLAIRASRLLRRHFGALGDENAKVVTSSVYGLGGLVVHRQWRLGHREDSRLNRMAVSRRRLMKKARG